MKGAMSRERVEALLEEARRASKRAYAPYSRYAVGAAVLTASDQIVSGCNVENASYGLSICAERAAIFAARGRELSDPSRAPIAAIAIVADGGPVPWPCGACRQVLTEFASQDAIVIVQGPDGVHEARLADLLPNAFRLAPEK
jgi:cytidine deaminase